MCIKVKSFKIYSTAKGQKEIRDLKRCSFLVDIILGGGYDIFVRIERIIRVEE